MSSNIRSDSGDAYHAWEDVKCTRQDFATERVQRLQREGVRDFPTLVKAFRQAGREYDTWLTSRPVAA